MTSAKAISEYYDQAIKAMQTFATSASGFVGPWTEALQKTISLPAGSEKLTVA